MSFIHFLRDCVLPNVFNIDSNQFIGCEIDDQSAGVDQFQSDVIFFSAVVQTEHGEKRIPLLVKFEMGDLELRKVLRSDEQFYNEVTMYKKVLPSLNKHNIVEDTFPKFYHGIGDVNDKKYLVLEDLRPLGYRLAEEKAFIDLDHLKIAMAKLGQFHALSYAAKKYSPEKFLSLTSILKERSWINTARFSYVINACFHRAVDPLINQDTHEKVLQGVLERVKDDESVTKFLKDLTAPEEPLAVICHGDFCRNNMFFKYDDEGRPVDAKFFDLATPRYSTPAVDISFFLLLNGSRDVRRAHWDELISVYHQGLSTAIPGLTVPSLEDIREDVRSKALYGFTHCSFFLPQVLFKVNNISNEAIVSFGWEKFASLYLSCGGEEGTKVMSTMVEDLVDLGCLSAQNRLLK